MTITTNPIAGVGQLICQRDDIYVFSKAETGKLVAARVLTDGSFALGAEYDMTASLSMSVTTNNGQFLAEVVGDIKMTHPRVFTVTYEKSSASDYPSHLASFIVDNTTLAITNVSDIALGAIFAPGTGVPSGPFSAKDNDTLTFLLDLVASDDTEIWTTSIDTAGVISGAPTLAGTQTNWSWNGFNACYVSETELLLPSAIDYGTSTLKPALIDLTSPTSWTAATVNLPAGVDEFKVYGFRDTRWPSSNTITMLDGYDSGFTTEYVWVATRSGSTWSAGTPITHSTSNDTFLYAKYRADGTVLLINGNYSTDQITFTRDAFGTPINDVIAQDPDKAFSFSEWGADSWVLTTGTRITSGYPVATDATVTTAWYGLPVPANNAHCGETVIKYEVTSNLYSSYALSPRGPDNDIHHSAFKIADESRTVSFMVSLSAEIGQDFYVQPQAQFLTWTGLGFTTVTTVNVGSPVHLIGDALWTTITDITDAPEGASHWYFNLSVTADSAGLVAPDLGTILYADCCYVPDNGLDVSAEPYLDGTQVGTIRGDAIWEGTAHNATSIWEVAEEPLPDPGDPGAGGGDGGGSGDPGDGGTAPPDEPPPPPPVVPPPPITPEDRAEQILSGVTPAGLCLDADVQLGYLDNENLGMIFNTIDSFGVLWIVTDIDGWWTLPEPDIPDFPRGVDDGSYESRGRYQARVFTLSGSFFPTSRSDVRPARDRLIRAANLCHKGAWFATKEPDAVRASKVWLSGQPQISTMNVNGRTDFSIGLKAPDPIKYGLLDGVLPGYKSSTMVSQTTVGLIGRKYDLVYPNRSYGGGAGTTAAVSNPVNAGNTRVYPIITVIGPTIGPIQIVNSTTDQTLRVQQTLAVGETLTIDCQNRTVRRGELTNQRFYLDTITDWIYLDPGTNQFFFIEEAGGSPSEVRVEWRSGWIG
jgi:hypothetical protein